MRVLPSCFSILTMKPLLYFNCILGVRCLLWWIEYCFLVSLLYITLFVELCSMCMDCVFFRLCVLLLNPGLNSIPLLKYQSLVPITYLYIKIKATAERFASRLLNLFVFRYGFSFGAFGITWNYLKSVGNAFFPCLLNKNIYRVNFSMASLGSGGWNHLFSNNMLSRRGKFFYFEIVLADP